MGSAGARLGAISTGGWARPRKASRHDLGIAVRRSCIRTILGRMGFRISGKIHAIFDAEQKTERFRLREFVLEISDGGRFEQYVKFQLTGDRCETIDSYSKGDEVEVEFSLRGREWNAPSGDIRYFNSLDVWTVQGTSDRAAGGPSGDEPPMPSEPPHLGEEPPF